MKRTFLFMACMLASVMMYAQEESSEYRPLVEEGKHWTYDNFMPLRPAEYDHYYYYDLKGDTLIAGQQCLKMYSENMYNDNDIRYEGALYEVNKKVYCFFPGKEQADLLYDFECVANDTIQVWEGQLVVKDIRTEDNGGIAIRKYILMPVVAAEDYMGEIFWVEGVGASKDFFGMLPLDGNYNTLNACELNGEKIYQTIERDLTEEGYHKMAIEGKRWNYIHYHLENDGWHEEPYSYVVKGDTIIRRTTYKKLYYQDAKTERFACLLLEKGRTVYKNTDFGNNSYDSPVLTTFFEFDREDFGRVFTWKAKNNSGNTNWMVYGVDTVEVNNRQFRRYTCLQKYSEESETLTTIKYDGEGVWHDIWVEGVGSASRGIEDQYPSHEPQVRSTSDYTTFVSCYENGECIFTANDFNIQTTTKLDEDMDYRPFVEEGKVWKYSYNNGRRQYMKSLTVSGDTIIGNQTYKKIVDVASQAVEMALREEGKKVYCCYPNQNTEYLLYDFGKNAGEVISKEIIYGNTRIRKVISVNTIMVKNNAFRCMTVHEYTIPEGMSEEEYFAGNYGYDSGFWVEGIGSFKYLDTPIPYDGDYYTFQECRIGDVTFKQKDFVAMPQNDYRPFVEDGKVWKVGNTQTISDNVVNVVDYYYFDGDTIIDGKTCKQMMCQRFVNPDYTNEYSTPKPSLTKVGAWYEEDKKVYFYEDILHFMRMKYDFSLGANDSLQLFDDNSHYIIGPKQTGGIKGFKGIYRDIMLCDDEGQSFYITTWLEGVGGFTGPIRDDYNDSGDRASFLMSCTVGDEVIYLNDEYEDGATPKDLEARKNRFDFTHTIKTKPKEPSKRREELSLYGEYDDSRLGINLNSLDDAYLVRIINESGEVVYEKTVNASAIVGLDIDISAYAKGRYTVTVENSLESFTGLFETQTSGIEAISYHPSSVKYHIYNLQGQRLSTFQKGLNIVNGQKLFVK